MCLWMRTPDKVQCCFSVNVSLGGMAGGAGAGWKPRSCAVYGAGSKRQHNGPPAGSSSAMAMAMAMPPSGTFTSGTCGNSDTVDPDHGEVRGSQRGREARRPSHHLSSVNSRYSPVLAEKRGGLPNVPNMAPAQLLRRVGREGIEEVGHGLRPDATQTLPCSSYHTPRKQRHLDKYSPIAPRPAPYQRA